MPEWEVDLRAALVRPGPPGHYWHRPTDWTIGQTVENMLGVLSLVQSHRRALDEIDRLNSEKAALLEEIGLYKDVLKEQGLSYDPQEPPEDQEDQW